MVQIKFFGKSDKGLKRTNNEDAFIVSPERAFALVADGMGGAAAGEVASLHFSQTALKVLRGSGRRTEKEAVDLVQKTFSLANKRILDDVKQNAGHEGMGCTAELLVFAEDSYVLGHVGDSRTYRFRQGHLKQLTRDHSLVEDQVEQGLISEAEARKHRLRNILLRAVGVGEDLSLDVITGRYYAEDLFLLCSDGLTDMVDDEQIVGILLSPSTIAKKTDNLIEVAKESGGKDNITVALVEIV